MGNLREWLLVAFYCVFLAGWMLVWETRKRKAADIRPALPPASILIWILVGLSFGLLMTFGWQAVHSPLVFITVGSFVCGLGITGLSRHERSKAFKQAGTWMKTASFFVFMGGLALLLVPQATLHKIGYLCLVAGGALLALDYFQSKQQGLPPISK